MNLSMLLGLESPRVGKAKGRVVSFGESIFTEVSAKKRAAKPAVSRKQRRDRKAELKRQQVREVLVQYDVFLPDVAVDEIIRAARRSPDGIMV